MVIGLAEIDDPNKILLKIVLGNDTRWDDTDSDSKDVYNSFRTR